MDWIVIVVVGAVIVALLALRQAGSVSPAAAADCLRQGAKVIDVRSPGEFRDRHLPGAINIPLGELEQRIGREVPDKNQVLLLHCLSGGRSALGRRTLRRMGYARVFNLGSLARAEQIAAEAAK